MPLPAAGLASRAPSSALSVRFADQLEELVEVRLVKALLSSSAARPGLLLRFARCRGPHVCSATVAGRSALSGEHGPDGCLHELAAAEVLEWACRGVAGNRQAATSR